MNDRILSCEEAIRLLADHLDDELDPDRRGDLERHLDLCRSCHARHEFEKDLKRQVAELAEEPVRPEFRERIRALVGDLTPDGGTRSGKGRT